MTDPLRPFVQIIRASLASKSTRPASDRATGTSPSSSPEARTTPNGSLQSRLAARLSAIDRNNTSRMRKTFVETVLLSELGENLAQDPAFAELVNRVSEQLGAHPTIGPRLQALLLQLSTE